MAHKYLKYCVYPTLLLTTKRLIYKSFLLLLIADEVVNVVLREDGDHGMRGDPEVVGGDADPQAQHSLLGHRFYEAVHHVLIGQLARGIYIGHLLLAFIFRIFVFTLSKGSDPSEADIPDNAEANSRIDIVSFFSEDCAISFYLASL